MEGTTRRTFSLTTVTAVAALPLVLAGVTTAEGLVENADTRAYARKRVLVENADTRAYARKRAKA